MSSINKTEILLNFSISISPKFVGNLGELDDDYEVENSCDELFKIQNMLITADYTFGSALTKTGKSSWKFWLSENQILTRRFKNFAPLIFRAKKTDNVLYEYQNRGVQWLLDNDLCILADDMGLGKTLQVIKAAERECFNKKTHLFLIFCPLSLIENWKSEISKWSPLFIVEEYSIGIAQQQLNRSNFLIIAYSRMEKFFSETEPKQIIDAVSIYDEAHKLRNEGAKVNKIANKIKTKKKWLLTGTPLERDSKDIETIITLLDPRITVANFKKSKFFLKSRFANYTLRRTKSEVLGDLPPLGRQVHYLRLLKDQSCEYEKLLQKQRDIPRKERIGVLTKMLMTASCSDNGKSNKIEKAIELAKQEIKNNNKVIIFSRFNKVLNEMAKCLSNEGISNQKISGEIDKDERNKRLKAFKDSLEANVLVINISVGSEGLTLTEANVVIFLNEWWNPSTNRQAEDRVNRIGQHKNVTIHILRSLNTIDINLENILKNKNGIEKEFLDLLLDDLSTC